MGRLRWWPERDDAAEGSGGAGEAGGGWEPRGAGRDPWLSAGSAGSDGDDAETDPAPAGAGREDAPPAADAADRDAERRLREALRAEVGDLLRERRLLWPGAPEREQIRRLIRDRVAAHQRLAATTNAPLLTDPAGTERRLYDALLGLGPLQRLMDDPAIEEVICNGHGRVFVVEAGRKREVGRGLFESDEELAALVKRLVGPLGRRLDESSPMVDARLPDGSRLNAVVPPVSTTGCCLTIRKFVLRAETLDGLERLGTLPPSAAAFLAAAVRVGENVLVSGPAGSGKTTLLNALGAAIASVDERVVTVEEVAELRLSRLPDCVGLQARPPNAEGVGEVRVRDLVRNALRMRPTRIIVGEVRGAEALDMLLAMNAGHDGSLSTIHGTSPRDALDRLVTLAMMAEERLSGDALTRMVARTVRLVLQLRADARTGRRRLVSVFEVTGLEGAVVLGNELWRLTPDGGRLAWTGLRPRCLARIRAAGVPYALPPAPEWSGDWEAGEAEGEEAAGPAPGAH
jgi:pilus assembly protein CpaF